jgi:hypothetical protein
MHIVATVLFALAGIVALTSPLALLTFWYRFPTSLDDLSKYETLFGTLMFAAALALIGAVLTSWNQRSISDRQIAAERWKQELTCRPEKQQIVSALIGEIDVIVNELRHESLRSAIENALRALETRTGKVEIDGTRQVRWEIFRPQSSRTYTTSEQHFQRADAVLCYRARNGIGP